MSAIRDRIIKYSDWAVAHQKPQSYGSGGRPPRDWPTPNVWPQNTDCSGGVTLVYMWATCGNPVYDPNGANWTGASSAAMLSHGHAIKLRNATPGGLIIHANHVEMFLEPYHGDSTKVVGWGSAPGHATTLRAENEWQLMNRGGRPYYRSYFP